MAAGAISPDFGVTKTKRIERNAYRILTLNWFRLLNWINLVKEISIIGYNIPYLGILSQLEEKRYQLKAGYQGKGQTE